MDKDFLFELLSQPTAPFRESHVIALISQRLRDKKVPFFQDDVGNIVVGATSRQEYRTRLQEKTKEPLRVFIAHMDHPGFHGVHWRSPRELEVKWLGGSPRKFLNGAKVWIADGVQGMRGKGVLAKAKLLPSKLALDSAVIRLDKPLNHVEPKALFGGFAFRAPVWNRGEMLYTKAADDLVGTFVISQLAIQVQRASKMRQQFIGLLTRAEEVGFVGAIGHFELGLLANARRPVVCVSLETSRTLPGAEIGRGPVVRLGDKATTFDAGALSVFSEVARRVLPGSHQRRIMDGGTCEATVATAYGVPAVGISIPLGNYHNQSFEGGPDSRGPLGPAPEFVHLRDIEGMLKLCHSLLEPALPWASPWESKVKEFRDRKRQYTDLLEWP